MAEIWKQNEEKSEDEELVVTSHRDVPTDAHRREANEESQVLNHIDAHTQVPPEQQQSVEIMEDDPRSALDALGEDVSSSAARRGHGEAFTGEE